MARMMTLKIHGARELERNLRELGTRVARRAVRETLPEIAEPVRAGMARNAPRRATPTKAGHLADNIVVAPVRVKDWDHSVAIGPDPRHFYGYFGEFGTSRQPARPWARPAWDEESGGLLPALGRGLWRRIAEAARRMRRRGGRRR